MDRFDPAQGPCVRERRNAAIARACAETRSAMRTGLHTRNETRRVGRLV